MRSVRSRDTTPELAVRKLLTKLGFRYRLHQRDIPGRPDIAFISKRKAIFVHGCFWHGHACKRGARVPKTNAEYWRAKIKRNRFRDARHAKELHGIGWQMLVLWECEVRDVEAIQRKLLAFLDD